MRSLLRFLGLPAVLLSLAAQAQTPVVLPVYPLTADPGRAATTPPTTTAQQRTTALALPFFEDFTTPSAGPPSPVRWQPAVTGYPDGAGGVLHYGGGGAYVSNRLAIDPPSRGAATLDGLKANGLPYNSSSTFYSRTDTLTSQPIDLSGFAASSQVYLSYAWQAGTLIGPPTSNTSSTSTSLTLEFLDNVGRWNSIWTYLGANKTTAFKQQIFSITNPNYFFSGFRFRFRSTGNQSSAQDAFGLDYIYLNNNRAANDTIYQDIATSRGLSSPLRRYTSMPVWQYNAATTSELNPALTTTINSLAASGSTPTPISWQGTVRELTTGGFGPTTWTTGNRPVPAAVRQSAISGDASTAPLSFSTQSRRFRYTLALQTLSANPLFLANDTISRDLELSNYFAYDDGTPEGNLLLPAYNTGPMVYMAVAFTANKADQVSAVQLAPIFNNFPLPTGENYQNRTVTVAVWNDNNGMPGTMLGTATKVFVNGTSPNQSLQDVPFTTPVSVSGRFYVGYGQPANGQFLTYGADRNNIAPASTLFYTNQGVWTPFTLSPSGSPMIRAVMNNNILATTAQQAVNAQFSLYPNPAPTGTAVAVSGPSFRRAALLDVLGREVWQQPGTEAGQATLRLPASLPGGVYLVQLALPDGSVATRRLVLE